MRESVSAPGNDIEACLSVVMKYDPAGRDLLPSGSHCRSTRRCEKTDLLLLPLIGNQGSVSTFVVHQPPTYQSVDLLMSRFLCRIGTTKSERHFAGKPRGNNNGRVRLNLEREPAAQKQ